MWEVAGARVMSGLRFSVPAGAFNLDIQILHENVIFTGNMKLPVGVTYWQKTILFFNCLLDGKQFIPQPQRAFAELVGNGKFSLFVEEVSFFHVESKFNRI